MAGAIDEDTARTIANGRETVGAMMGVAQARLKRLFVVFVVGFILTFYGMRAVWDQLKADLLANMGLPPEDAPSVVAVTPFDVILLQVKIGMIVGVLVAVPLLVYYGRDGLKERGIWPDRPVARWKLVLLGLMITVLFGVGFVYAYAFFFPVMFQFLATNAVKAGFKPTYSIVKWTEFIFFLTLSFGLAAQLPLGMSATASAGVVRYETFRDKWRYAVMGIFLFGAVFSPPDPFTQVMWAVPLIALYWFSLGVTKLVVLAQRAGDAVPVRQVARERWNVLAGVFVLATGGTYAFLTRGGLAWTNSLLEAIGSSYRAPAAGDLELLGLSPVASAALPAAVVGVVGVGVAFFYLRIKALERVQATRAAEAAATEPTAPAGGGQATETGAATAASVGAPAEIDVRALSTPAVKAAPVEAFADMTEAEALELAEHAIHEEENPEKAQLVLDRFDEAEAETVEGPAPEAEDSNPVSSTAAGMMDAFTEEETTEDDIGGYYHDIAFILESLTSKAMWIVGVFMVVLAATFVALYSGGIGVLKNVFLSHMPPALRPAVDIVTLHPVEALIFEVKFSTLLAAVSILPLLLYWAWPALEERGVAGGDRNILIVWGGTLLVTLVGGSLVGFLYIAPAIISFLAQDALASSMVIAYRINHFGWLVILFTVGIGFLTEVPVTMLLFDRGGIVSYRTMRRRWRVVVIGLFVFAGLVSPRGVFTMLLLALPGVVAFGAGLGLLWLVTRLSPSRSHKPEGEAAD